MPDDARPFISGRWLSLWLAIGLALATGLLFWPAVGYDYINLDDPQYVFDNPHVITGLSWSNIRWAFTTVHESWWLPVLWISYMVDVTLFGTSPSGFHFVNILLHTANALLLFWVLRRGTGQLWPSAFVAALFALHPLRLESVAWITERKDVLSGFFWMLALAVYIGQGEKPSAGRQASVFLLMLLGALSKASVVTLPAALLLLDYWPLQRLSSPIQWKHRLLEKIPLFILSAALAAITLATHTREGAGQLSPLSGWERLTLIPANYLPYLAKTFWPLNLSIYYPENDAVRWFSFFGASALLLAITLVFWRLRRRAPYLLMGWLWFGIILSPVIRGVRIGLADYVDRFMYLPSTGLNIMLAWGFSAWLAGRPRGRVALGMLGAAVLIACSGLTVYNLRFWRNSDTLFTRTWELDPDNYLGITGRGIALQRQEQWEDARRHFSEAVTRHPHVVRYRVHLALTLINMDRLPEAFALLEPWRLREPDEPEFLYALGLAYLHDHQPEAASIHLQKAIQKAPRPPPFYYAEWARALFESGSEAEARNALNRIWPEPPTGSWAYRDLIPHYARQWEATEKPRALRYFQNLARREADNAAVLNNIAWLLAVSEPSPAPPEEAVTLAHRALELTGGDHPVVLNTLAAAYANAGRFEEAMDAAERAHHLALESGQSELARRLLPRMAAYRHQRPWRESTLR